MIQATPHRTILIAMLAVSLAGCAAIPAFGPDAEAINNAALADNSTAQDMLPFQVIDVNATTLPNEFNSGETFPASFRNQAFLEADEVFGIGDQIEIRIWEVAEDGLFATAGKKETVLNAQVLNSGNINVPYAGTIEARGLTTSELRALLLERYRGQAVEPEIAVGITATEARSATMIGDVRSPGRISIPPRGLRLLDLVAKAGGAPEAPWEVSISIQRNEVSGSVSLADVIDVSANNIVVLPGDTINVSHEPRRFAVYGGVSRPSNIEIPIEEAHLSYLLAEVGGLDDRVAQTQSVFVFRPANAGSTATAYRFDFSRPDALLLASAFRLSASDITYVDSAGAADFHRFVSIILSPLLGAASATTNLGN